MKLPTGYVPGHGLQQGSGFGGFGQQMLERMGWSKGQGLGKTQNGMKDALEVKQKEDNRGVGAGASWNWDMKYLDDAYNSAVQKVAHNTSSSSGSDSSSTSSSSDDSNSDDTRSVRSSSSDESGDDDESALNSIMQQLLQHRDGTLSSATAEELRLAQQLAKDPWGRFGGRDGKLARIRQQEEAQAALARARLGLAAPQGAPAAAAAAAGAAGPASVTGRARKSASQKRKRKEVEGAAEAAGAGSPSSSPLAAATDAVVCNERKTEKDHQAAACDVPLAANARKPKRRRNMDSSAAGAAAAAAAVAVAAASAPCGQAAAANGKSKPKRVVVVVDRKAPAKACSFRPTPSTGWWGARSFTSSGLLEGLKEAQEQRVQRERAAFDEGDQEALYTQAHATKRQGRRGLGKSDKLKVAGGGWQGQKTTFADDIAGEGEGRQGGQEQQGQQEGAAGRKAAARTAGASGGTAADGVPTRKKDKRKHKHRALAVADAAADAACEWTNKQQQQQQKGTTKPKWVKETVALLREAPGGQLKWRKVWKGLWAAHVGAAGGLSEGQQHELCLVKLHKSSKVAVDGKLVTLAQATA